MSGNSGNESGLLVVVAIVCLGGYLILQSIAKTFGLDVTTLLNVFARLAIVLVVCFALNYLGKLKPFLSLLPAALVVCAIPAFNFWGASEPHLFSSELPWYAKEKIQFATIFVLLAVGLYFTWRNWDEYY